MATNGTRSVERIGRRLIAPCLLGAALLIGGTPAFAHAGPLVWPQDMQCTSNAQRLDHRPDLKEHVLPTQNGSIGYFRFGAGSPIVLITGYRATMAEWNADFLQALARHHEVIVFDNRGIGQSQSHAPGYSASDLAGDAAALIRGLGLKDPTVLGWSMGGIVAQQLALDHPELVSKLVLMSTLPPGPQADLPSAEVMQTLSGSGEGHFDRVMDTLFPAAAQDSAKACFIDDMFAPHGYAEPAIPAAVTRAQDALLERWKEDGPEPQQLRRLAVPSLVLAGTQDTVLAPANSVTLSHLLGDSTLVEVEGGGHAMMYQYPRALADRIDRFIANDSQPVAASK